MANKFIVLRNPKQGGPYSHYGKLVSENELEGSAYLDTREEAEVQARIKAKPGQECWVLEVTKESLLIR